MFRIGFAEDIHRLVAGRQLRLGHVLIDYPFGLLGNSDGDVVLHALTEAILGALARGDLGTHFPDTTDEFKDIDSSVLLKRVLEMMKIDNYEICNCDISIFAEKPRLAQYLPIIRQEIADLCQIALETVSLKACTNEGLDAVGRMEAMKATAIVLLRKKG